MGLFWHLKATCSTPSTAAQQLQQRTGVAMEDLTPTIGFRVAMSKIWTAGCALLDVMHNLQSLGCPLRGLAATPNLIQINNTS